METRFATRWSRLRAILLLRREVHDENRAAMARVAFHLFAIGATLGLVSLGLPGNSGRDRAASLVVVAAAYLASTVPLVGFDRLPLWAFEALAAIGTAVISAGLAFGGKSAIAFSVSYFWVILYAGYFFSRRQATAQLGFVISCYAAVLLAKRPPGLTVVTWMITAGTIAVAGALILFLRGRVSTVVESAQASNERLRALIEASPAAILELDPRGHVRLWNRTAELMFGWRSAEVVGAPPPVVPTDSLVDHAQFLARAVADGFAHAELRVERRDGRPVEVAVSAAPVLDAEGRLTGTMEMLTDVSERKRLEEELRQAQRMEALGRLAGGIAHDFNNILLAIKSQAWLLLDSLDEQAPERRTVEALDGAADRAATLTRQLLAFSRRQVLQPRLLDLNETVASMQELLQRLIGEHVELVSVLDPELGPVRADPGQIEQVLVNLVVNARDAMPSGGQVTIETRSLERALGYVVLSVTDTGIGVEPENRPHIFEPFFTTKATGYGTGLGLAIVHGIVRQSRGYIEVASEPGRGATFSIYLPCAEGELNDAMVQHNGLTLVSGCETVLLAEDESLVREPIRTILEQHGYRVLAAANGEEALAEAARYDGHIDVLLTDVVMPTMDGPELARQLLAERPGVRVVYMSGYVDRSAKLLEQLETGGAAVLQKPFAPAALARAIQEALAQDSTTGHERKRAS